MGEIDDDTDVLIVGAGPTGLMMANCLSRLGVRFVLIDGKTEPTRESRALVLQARTMEIYDQLGLVDRVLERAKRVDALTPGFESTAFRRVDISRLSAGLSRFPALFVLEQSANERMLVDALEERGESVRWATALDDLRDDGAGVTATVRTDHGTSTIRARYCVGADGGSSRVRESAGIPFDGTTNQHTFYVADAVGVTGLERGVNIRFGTSDFLLAFPMAGRHDYRLIGVVRNAEMPAVAERHVRERLRRFFGVDYRESRWFSTYRVHHRVAREFRRGAVFLAGDAAHVHSPVGAQGMNTGLQDAHNLAAKMADVVLHGAPDASLDRYEAERRPVAQRLIATTDAVFDVVTSDRAVARTFRRVALRAVAPIAPALVPRLPGASRFFGYVSQTRIHYWMRDEAKAERNGRRGTVVGRRLPTGPEEAEQLRSMRWQVHVYGDVPPGAVESAASRLGVPVHHHEQVPDHRLRRGWFHLVRPDGFVAAAAPAERADRLATALPWNAGA
ncbi:2-polyprenyl-6-methoxyphenol hydroxylase-like FAD-dependent oxidoreductase [Diaminobutyricimonas aerilata]|uniref:2-polyprenyl-6-methoxyphenol hydroxylase-like FAD-dependent oxidoreductase n=1 Tax=Diaminobutyricimonas aerilata TaxID=1162967 RepID=A0A2M9CLV6_9MICO|nr:FAD-dependent monooxygenase [Diaminobutyricimonas aerilata]PJJ72883.1 2-polyprenyl-6-methoxyphenol hydroxylase-like FAD-dependent oxidoreductase [Diaminobutyricimonas aerilata]